MGHSLKVVWMGPFELPANTFSPVPDVLQYFRDWTCGQSLVCSARTYLTELVCHCILIFTNIVG